MSDNQKNEGPQEQSLLERLLEERLEFELDRNEVEKEKIKLRYRDAHQLIAHAAEKTGWDAELLTRCCMSVARHYRDIKWDDIMDIVRSVFVDRERREKEKGEK